MMKRLLAEEPNMIATRDVRLETPDGTVVVPSLTFGQRLPDFSRLLTPLCPFSNHADVVRICLPANPTANF